MCDTQRKALFIVDTVWPIYLHAQPSVGECKLKPAKIRTCLPTNHNIPMTLCAHVFQHFPRSRYRSILAYQLRTHHVYKKPCDATSCNITSRDACCSLIIYHQLHHVYTASPYTFITPVLLFRMWICGWCQSCVLWRISVKFGYKCLSYYVRSTNISPRSRM